MSDIHGCFNEFQEMLEKITFSDADQLIIAGDYIDRGTQNVQMLRWIDNAPDNVMLLKGNHDAEFAMCVDIMCRVIAQNDMRIEDIDSKKLYGVYSYVKDEMSADLFDYYGTMEKLITEDNVSLSDLIRWMQLIDDMPYFFKLRINGILHVVVHAGYLTDEKMEKRDKEKYPEKESFYIYAREDALKINGLKDAVVISGHTPTIAGGVFGTSGNVFEYRNPINNVTHYDIDCGIAYRSDKYPNAKLACIRLEDKKQYYI